MHKRDFSTNGTAVCWVDQCSLETMDGGYGPHTRPRADLATQPFGRERWNLGVAKININNHRSAIVPIDCHGWLGENAQSKIRNQQSTIKNSQTPLPAVGRGPAGRSPRQPRRRSIPKRPRHLCPPWPARAPLRWPNQLRLPGRC